MVVIPVERQVDGLFPDKVLVAAECVATKSGIGSLIWNSWELQEIKRKWRTQ